MMAFSMVAPYVGRDVHIAPLVLRVVSCWFEYYLEVRRDVDIAPYKWQPQ